MKKMYAVIVKDFEYEYYNKNVLKKGMRLEIGRRGPGGCIRQNDGLIFIIGHGTDVLVPNEFFRLEEEEVIVNVKRIRRPVEL